MGTGVRQKQSLAWTEAEVGGVMPRTIQPIQIDECLGHSCLERTCLHWGEDGELSDLDYKLIVQRLCRVDLQACQSLSDSC